MSEMERCDLSDLPADQCACRVHARPVLTGDPFAAAGGPGEMVGWAFMARFDGTCQECAGWIYEGDSICHSGDWGYVHEGCA
jgi:hypothetical protein